VLVLLCWNNNNTQQQWYRRTQQPLANRQDSGAEMEAENFLNNLEKSLERNFRERSVLPGDDVTQDIDLSMISNGENIELGSGLQLINQHVLCRTAGILKFKEPKRYWIEQDLRKVWILLFTPASPSLSLLLVFSKNR
jgi:hypothetical protein